MTNSDHKHSPATPEVPRWPRRDAKRTPNGIHDSMGPLQALQTPKPQKQKASPFCGFSIKVKSVKTTYTTVAISKGARTFLGSPIAGHMRDPKCQRNTQPSPFLLGSSSFQAAQLQGIRGPEKQKCLPGDNIFCYLRACWKGGCKRRESGCILAPCQPSK